jgi:hypothetical protein
MVKIFIYYLGKTYHERKFHTKYLPHKCCTTGCDAEFASKSALNYHIKSQHLRSSKKTKSVKSKFGYIESNLNRMNSIDGSSDEKMFASMEEDN